MENVDIGIRSIQNTSEIKRNIESVKETAGWKLLLPEQQKMVRSSLLFSNRSFRETDPASADAIGTEFGKELRPMIYEEEELKNQFKLNPNNHKFFLRGYNHSPEDRKYRESQNLIAKLNCHQAVRSLEVGKFSYIDPEKKDAEYFKMNMNTVAGGMISSEIEDIINEKINKIGYPCIFVSYKGSFKPSPDHSFLIFGPNKNGQVMCWDKIDWGRPFRITTLSKLLEENYQETQKDDDYIFGLRSLRVLSKEQI